MLDHFNSNFVIFRSYQNMGARIWNSILICLLSLLKCDFKWYTKTAAEHFDAKVNLC